MRNIRPGQGGSEQCIDLKGIYKPINDSHGVWMFAPSIVYDGISFYTEELERPHRLTHYRIEDRIRKDYERNK